MATDQHLLAYIMLSLHLS